MKKLTIIGLSVVVLVVCVLLLWPHTKPPADSDSRQGLPGTWVWQKHNPQSDWRFTSTIAPDGTFQSELLYSYRTSSATDHIEGTWQVTNGLFLETITNDSNIHRRVPRIASGQIIRMDTREFVLVVWDSTNKSVWKRVSQ